MDRSGSAGLAEDLPPECLCLDVRVRSVGADAVELESGETIEASAVVVATDGPEAARLAGLKDVPPYRPALCLYYAAPVPPVATDAPSVSRVAGESSIRSWR